MQGNECEVFIYKYKLIYNVISFKNSVGSIFFVNIECMATVTYSRDS